LRRALLVLALLAGLAPAAAAELRRLEAVGAQPLDPDRPPARPPRDLAVQKGLADAVRRVAFEEAPELDPEQAEARVGAALGADPLAYVNRFRIVEDQGERPALFTEDPGVESEYVVLLEVQVDADRVRRRLVEAGLAAAPSEGARRVPVRVVVEDVGSWASYRAVRTLLEEVGVRSAVPVEMQRGRAVLDVEGDRGPEELLAALLRAAPPELRLVPLGSDATTLRLRAVFLAPPAPAGAGAAAGPPRD
jgi:hypothetical protein